MCFSATASFTTATLLMPVAAYTIRTAWMADRRYLGFAVFPLFFGFQQFLEGGIWMTIGQPDAARLHLFALGFLFFAYFVWPFLVPFATWLVEARKNRRRIFLGLSAFGFLLGLSLFAPLMFHPDWVPLRIEKHSIDYNSRLIWEGIVPYTVIRIIYAGIVCLPLLLSSEKHIRIFGVIITLSVIAGFIFAQYAFTSVWCFMAAIVSSYLLLAMRDLGRRHTGSGYQAV
ncbi:DUF6629 family protein [Cognatishimia sp. F0-27]|uniref:DUF6629 family protein n=1 Tax=Cognatishimia sp. F0-27 TaxID=2816855 RepID=UPI001D0C8AEB|nr:DUF6629 family protein [Cognatishimia sp. F0-27]MCC1491460.1 hypothetical protein [Cognatishimia sp. F0-27]